MLVMFAAFAGQSLAVGPMVRQNGAARPEGKGLIEAQLKLELRRAGGRSTTVSSGFANRG